MLLLKPFWPYQINPHNVPKWVKIYIKDEVGVCMCVCVCVCVCVSVCVKSLSHVWLFVTPWTIAHQAPLPMEFSKQEYWSG